MIKKYVTGLLAATALAGTAWATSATDASEIVTSVSSDIETYLSDNTLDQAEANELLDYIAVEEVGKFALGRAGRDASAEDIFMLPGVPPWIMATLVAVRSMHH